MILMHVMFFMVFVVDGETNAMVSGANNESTKSNNESAKSGLPDDSGFDDFQRCVFVEN